MAVQISHIADTLPYYGKKDLLVEEHTTEDIVKHIKKGHNLDKDDYDTVSEKFWKGDAEHTAAFIFDFLKKHVRYDIEHPDNQSTKSAGAIIHQRHGDCKHYALWTNGIISSLHRKGYPVSSSYRFVADGPGRDVHHVFAIVTDGHNEWWVDPVLKHFNERPIFYNHKNVSMGNLYRISGTGADAESMYFTRPRNLPTVGKKKHHGNNIFKKLAHSIQVNTHNAGKGIEHAAQSVEHIALNVGVAPARNAFLALLDLNAFNLATRMAEAIRNHGAAVKGEWKKLGGNAGKLLSAINNGLKHKAYYHHQAPPKKVSGTIEEVISGRHPHMHTHRMKHHFEVPTIVEAYHTGCDDYGHLPVVSGIGEPVSIGTLSALASALIAAFSKWMKPDKGADQSTADAAKEGVENLVTNASDAMEAGQTDTGMKMMQAAQKGAGALQAAAGVGPDGTPTLAVTAFDHPQLQNAGTPVSYTPGSSQELSPQQETQYEDPKDITNIPKNLGTDFFNSITSNIKLLWDGYKQPIIFTAVGIGVYKIATRKRKGRR